MIEGSLAEGVARIGGEPSAQPFLDLEHGSR
jgi:hypothetical protein